MKTLQSESLVFIVTPVRLCDGTISWHQQNLSAVFCYYSNYLKPHSPLVLFIHDDCTRMVRKISTKNKHFNYEAPNWTKIKKKKIKCTIFAIAFRRRMDSREIYYFAWIFQLYSLICIANKRLRDGESMQYISDCNIKRFDVVHLREINVCLMV